MRMLSAAVPMMEAIVLELRALQGGVKNDGSRATHISAGSALKLLAARGVKSALLIKDWDGVAIKGEALNRSLTGLIEDIGTNFDYIVPQEVADELYSENGAERALKLACRALGVEQRRMLVLSTDEATVSNVKNNSECLVGFLSGVGDSVGDPALQRRLRYLAHHELEDLNGMQHLIEDLFVTFVLIISIP